MRPQSAILLLGGNRGKVMASLAAAVLLIDRFAGKTTAVSRVYSTRAWGPVEQPDFLNLAIRIATVLPPGLLMQKLLSIEKQLGRKRELRYGPRTIDIDILFYGSRVINTQELTVPHPEIQNRRFALQPCADIAARFVHPILKKDIKTLLSICSDTLEVKEWKG